MASPIWALGPFFSFDTTPALVYQGVAIVASHANGIDATKDLSNDLFYTGFEMAGFEEPIGYLQDQGQQLTVQTEI